MAFLHCDFYSAALGMMTGLCALLPESGDRPLSETKVLTLLHGLSDDATAWERRTSIERYADAYGVAVIMPSAARSFYCDMACGPKYWRHISQEVPRIARRLFGLSDRRELNMVAGLSMGGYGAFRHALELPDRYFAAGSFSGALDLSMAVESIYQGGMNVAYPGEAEAVLGDLDAVRGSKLDLLRLLDDRKHEGAALPRLFQTCGTEDYLYRPNESFRTHAAALGVPVTYREWPGDHEWGFWDRSVREFLAWALDEK